MRILHVLDHSLPVQSGYSFRSHAILREQRRLGWETVQVTSSKQGSLVEAVESAGGLDLHRTAGNGLLSRLPVLSQLDVIRRLRKRLEDIVSATQPDVIQAHSPCLTALAALGLGPPLVYEMRSSWEDAAVSSGATREGSLRYRLSRALETFVLHRADAVTTICEGLRDEILGRGVPRDKVTTIPNAVDIDAFAGAGLTGESLRAKLGLQDKYVLGFIGSFFAWEGLALLIEALPQILAVRSDVRVLLVGSGPDEWALRQAVSRFGLASSVVFAGEVRHDDIICAYDAVDLLVYPRTPIRLTEMVTPLKPLEAMALEKVFVASDVGGHRELVRDGITGILFKAGDAISLAQSIIRVASNALLRDSLREAARRFVREERTWNKVVRGYEPVYRKLMSCRPSAQSARSL
jgi:PEP-CTERM/exosortase A-associated glycosyltransferase